MDESEESKERSISPEFIVRPVIRTYFRRSRSKSSGGRSDSEGGRSESEAKSDLEDSDRRSTVSLPLSDGEVTAPTDHPEPPEGSVPSSEKQSEEMMEVVEPAEEKSEVKVDESAGEMVTDTVGSDGTSAEEEKVSPEDESSTEAVVSGIENEGADKKVETSEVKGKKRGRKKKSVDSLPSQATPTEPTQLRRTSRVIKKIEPQQIDYRTNHNEGKKLVVKTKAALKSFEKKTKGKLDRKKSKSDSNLILKVAAADADSDSNSQAPLLRSVHKTVGKFRYLASSDDAESSSGSPSVDFEKHVAEALKGLKVGESALSMEVDEIFKHGAGHSGVSRSAPATPVPGKVKSRWRKSSELELRQPSDSDSTPSYASPKHSVPFERVPLTEEEEGELKQRLSEFEQIETNVFLTKKSVSKERMHCDCTLTKEEIANGEMGCLEDCLNRLLMIECGPDCSLRSNCMNKYFQERKNGNIEVFKTAKKGFGLRALEDMEPGTFLMEYVGEVINMKQFERRKKIYAKDSSTHYYFMALKSDTIIDATNKGNISRFINHSCDPNSETQKWTVNGELRIGFFTKVPVKAGEELTFDYQYERYGKEAQRCFCDARNCRGWIGEVPSDDEDYESDISEFEESPTAPPEPSPEAPPSPPAVTTEVVEERVEIEAVVENVLEEAKEEEEKEDLVDVEVKQVEEVPVVEAKEVDENVEVVKKRKRRVRMSRIFQEEDDLDIQIGELLKTGLKNKTQTLTFCRLMVRAERAESKSSLLSLLSEERSDPACRRLLLDYHGLKLLGCWLVDPATSDGMKLEILQAIESLPIPNKTMIIESKVYSIVEKWAQESEGVESSKASPDDGSPLQDNETEKEIKSLSQQLLEAWSSLKEVFKIPKKERIEAMKEHEREADRNEPKQDSRNWQSRRFHESRNERWSQQDRFDKDYRRRDHLSPDWRRKEYADSLSKDERRQRFMLQVQREEEENRKRKRREEMARNHEMHCKALGLDPNDVPLFIDPATGEPVTQPPPPPDPGVDPSSLTYYIDPLTGQWTVYMPEHMQLPPGYDPSTIGRFSYDTNTGMMIESHTGYQLDPTQPLGIAEFLMANYPVKHMEYDPNEENYPAGTLIFNLETGDMHVVREEKSVKKETSAESENGKPTTKEYKLPAKWASAVDSQGRTYYYHIKDRVPQWNRPEPSVDGESDSDESETDSDEESRDDSHMEVDQHSGTRNLTPPFRSQDHLARERNTRRERRRDLLVQEHLISPRDENEARNPYINKESAYAYRKQMMKEKLNKKRVIDETDKEKAEKVREKIRKEKEKLKAKYKAKLQKLSDAEKKIREKKMKQKIKQDELAKKKLAQSEALRNRIREKLESSVYGTNEKNDESDHSKVEVKDEGSSNVESQGQESQQSSVLVINESEPKAEVIEESVVTTCEATVEAEQEEASIPPSEQEVPPPAEASEETMEVEAEDKTEVEPQETVKEKADDVESKKHKKEKEKLPALDFETEKGKRIKEEFRKSISNVVVTTLNPFFRSDAKYARITSNDDFKHLARKFTHFVMQKEIKHCKIIDDYVCSDSVKQKAKDFIRKYMKKFGPVYRKGLDEDLKV